MRNAERWVFWPIFSDFCRNSCILLSGFSASAGNLAGEIETSMDRAKDDVYDEFQLMEKIFLKSGVRDP
jgi:hypothetical protein